MGQKYCKDIVKYTKLRDFLDWPVWDKKKKGSRIAKYKTTENVIPNGSIETLLKMLDTC